MGDGSTPPHAMGDGSIPLHAMGDGSSPPHAMGDGSTEFISLSLGPGVNRCKWTY